MAQYQNGAATQMFYARKRRHARQETTAGPRGGLRDQKQVLGLTMQVTLTLS